MSGTNLVAKGQITLYEVNDGYSLQLTSPSITLTANLQGFINYNKASTDVRLFRGSEPCDFTIQSVVANPSVVKYSVDGKTVRITSVGTNNMFNGTLQITVKPQNDSQLISTNLYVSVLYNPIEVSWLRDWDGRLTQIGEDYVVTPKIFAGLKGGSGEISGVYMGPDKLVGKESSNPLPGIYGYQNNAEIFSLNRLGGKIGGWEITPNSIRCHAGNLVLDSNGSIQSNPNDIVQWKLSYDGSGQFAGGRIVWTTGGSVIIGNKVGHQVIIDNQGNALYTGTLNANQIIAGTIKSSLINADELLSNGLKWALKSDGSGYLANQRIQWTKEGTVVIGNSSNNQCVVIDSNGNAVYKGNLEASQVNALTCTFTKGTIGKWTIKEEAILNGRAALVSANTHSGLYLGANSNSNFDFAHVSTYENRIKSYGGIYAKSKSDSAELAGYSTSGHCMFMLSTTGQSTIAKWNFDTEALFTETKKQAGFTTGSGITLGALGLRGPKWRFEKDGSGAVAGGNISWDSLGGGSIANQKIRWTSDGNLFLDDSVFMSWGVNLANSKMLFRDPMFLDSNSKNNGLIAYNDDNNGVWTFVLVPNVKDSPSGVALTVVSANGNLKHKNINWGVSFTYQASFVIKIRSIIPTTHRIDFTTNCNVLNYQWLTTTQGTGEWCDYSILCRLSQPYDGRIAVGLKLDGEDGAPNSPLVWKLCYATIFELGSSDSVYTKIDKDGIYTGTLNASQITAGTIQSSLINSDELLSNGNAWALKKDGSGYLANKHFTWDSSGNTSFEGRITAYSGQIGCFAISEAGTLSSFSMSDEKRGMSLDKHNLRIHFVDVLSQHNSIEIGHASNMGSPLPFIRIASKPTAGKPFDAKNTGIYFDFEKSDTSRVLAFSGVGSGLLDGCVDGFGFAKHIFTSSSPSDMYLSELVGRYVSVNRFIISNQSSNSACRAVLFKLQYLLDSLNLGTNDKFCFQVTIISDVTSTRDFRIYGWNSHALPDTSYPVVISQTGTTMNFINLSKCNVVTLMLVYDPDNVQTLSVDGKSVSYRYTARIVSKMA